MAVEAKLQWTAVCDDCGKIDYNETSNHDWFGGIDEDAMSATDFLYNLEHNQNWEVTRESYETLKVFCPGCVAKEKGIAEFEAEQKRRKLSESNV